MYRLSPFSFAVQASPAVHAAGWERLAQVSEDLGYRALLVPDHIGSGGPLVGTTLAGAATTTLRVGPLVLCVDFRNPVLLAEELVTLDAALSGRLEVGLGAGWLARDYRRAGVPMAPAGVRIDRLCEFVEVLTKAWAVDPFDHAGANYELEGAVVAPAPHSAQPKLVLGGGGDRMLTLAAERADIVNVSASMHGGGSAPLGHSASGQRFARRAELIADRAAGRGFWPELQCLVFECTVTSDAGSVARRHVDEFGLPVDEVLRTPLTLLGTVDELCRKLETCREQFGISYWVVKSEVLHDFAPVVRRMSGR